MLTLSRNFFIYYYYLSLLQLSPTTSKKSSDDAEDDDEDDEDDDEKLSTSCTSDIDPERLKAFNVSLIDRHYRVTPIVTFI